MNLLSSNIACATASSTTVAKPSRGTRWPAQAQPMSTELPTKVGVGQGECPQSATAAGADDRGGRFPIGPGAGCFARHEGPDAQKAQALPSVSDRNSRFLGGVRTGIGYRSSLLPRVDFGPALPHRPLGRDDNASGWLREAGDSSGGADAGAFARWRIDPFFLHGGAEHAVGNGPDSMHGRLGTSYGTASGSFDRLLSDASPDWVELAVTQAGSGVSAVIGYRF